MAKVHAAIFSWNVRISCDNDTLTDHATLVAMKYWRNVLLPEELLASSLAIPKIASDCGCDGVGHSDLGVWLQTTSR